MLKKAYTKPYGEMGQTPFLFFTKEKRCLDSKEKTAKGDSKMQISSSEEMSLTLQLHLPGGNQFPPDAPYALRGGRENFYLAREATPPGDRDGRRGKNLFDTGLNIGFTY
jgi:hypothetical protein